MYLWNIASENDLPLKIDPRTLHRQTNLYARFLVDVHYSCENLEKCIEFIDRILGTKENSPTAEVQDDAIVQKLKSIIVYKGSLKVLIEIEESTGDRDVIGEPSQSLVEQVRGCIEDELGLRIEYEQENFYTNNNKGIMK